MPRSARKIKTITKKKTCIICDQTSVINISQYRTEKHSCTNKCEVKQNSAVYVTIMSVICDNYIKRYCPQD